MCAAVARTEQKYSIPRNPLIPEQTALDILAPGSLFKSQNGAAEGYAVPVQTLHAVAETTRLARAARRVILGIEVEHYSRPPQLRARRVAWCSRAGRRALVRRRSVSSVKVTVVKLAGVKVGEVASCRVRTATTRTTHGHALASDRVRVP